MTGIPLNSENAKKCMCPSCPVQSVSKCVRQQLSGLKEALKSNPLKADSVPGVYCASGKAVCQDIDFKKPCICASCLVYTQYKLKSGAPQLYYCRDGEWR